MIEINPSHRSPTADDCYSRRVAYCSKVFRIIFRLSGIILIVVQIVKLFEAESLFSWDFASHFLTLILGGLILVASLPGITNRAVAKFAARINNRKFALYTYIFPLLFTCLLLIVKIQLGHDSDRWDAMGKEGGLSEYGTAISYLLMTVFAYPMTRKFWQGGQKIMAVLYGFLTFAAFFVSMEEISWGQRLIGFEEPQYWAENNAQSEFTFHNLSFYQEHLLNQSFIVIGLIGSFCWLALWYWRKRQSQSQPKLDWSYILPDWTISSYFYPTLVFYVIHVFTDGLGFFITNDQEHCEFIMSVGILLFILINFFRQGQEPERNLSK
ncbi:MAG: hypothetical protein AAFQ41_06705 [Cyanobacteria bacterium J06623_7]